MRPPPGRQRERVNPPTIWFATSEGAGLGETIPPITLFSMIVNALTDAESPSCPARPRSGFATSLLPCRYGGSSVSYSSSRSGPSRRGVVCVRSIVLGGGRSVHSRESLKIPPAETGPSSRPSRPGGSPAFSWRPDRWGRSVPPSLPRRVLSGARVSMPSASRPAPLPVARRGRTPKNGTSPPTRFYSSN
jgi:hypothetical protein